MNAKVGHGTVVLFAMLMTGCALTPEEAAHMSSYGLCEKMLTSNNSTTREVAFNTLDSKGLENCYAHADEIQRARAASDAAMERFANQLQTLSNQVDQQQQRQQQTFCNTYGNGPYGTVHCWQQ